MEHATYADAPSADGDDEGDTTNQDADPDAAGADPDAEEAEAEPGAEEGDSGTAAAPIPAHLKDISNLASWTVSSAKPGCSVAQLRSPSTALYWQSDGPQPHTLDVHFFKMVEIAGVRVYLDFDLDESYTPTKIAFLAGTGYNDLQEWCVMGFENPKGWIDVDFSGVGGEGHEGEGGGGGGGDEVPVLRAMLVQVQIRENHQNGKDTHLRGLQIFARDKAAGDAAAADGTGGAGGFTTAGAPAADAVPAPSEKQRRKPRARLPEPEWGSAHVLR